MRYLLAVCLLCFVRNIHAGTVTGTAEGLADIQIQQIVAGTPGQITGYHAVPSTLEYTVLADSSNPAQDYFQFSFTSAVYSFDTTSSLINGFRSYGFSEPAPNFELGFLLSSVAHSYALTADIGLFGTVNPQISAGVDYTIADSTGTGVEAKVSFVDPPPAASVPEPSSVVMMLTGLITILFWSLR